MREEGRRKEGRGTAQGREGGRLMHWVGSEGGGKEEGREGDCTGEGGRESYSLGRE